MELDIRNAARGLRFVHGRDFSLSFPGSVWKDYPDNKFLFQELAALLTLAGPITSGRIRKVEYSTPRPFFFDRYLELMRKSIPESTEDYRQSAEAVLERFNAMEYTFSGDTISPSYLPDPEEKAVIPLSAGKDSLLSFALCREIGLDPAVVYINGHLVRQENIYKKRLIGIFRKRFKAGGFVVDNQLEGFNDFEFWDVPETCLPYMHMMTGFAFMMLPFTHATRSGYVVLGNQQDLDFRLMGSRGLMNPSFDQTSHWQSVQDRMVQRMTSGRVRVTSVIRPMANIFLMKVLHTRYPDIAKHQFSCDCLTGTGEKRWCHECSSCAKNFIFLKALGVNPRTIGFRKSMLSRDNRDSFSLFSRRLDDADEKTPEAREQQMLAFLMAYRNGAKGYLMDVFRKRYLKEAMAKEDYLMKKFFRVYPADMPRKIKFKIRSILKEELGTVVV
ncbi:hypothetical protein JW968_04935 [Candidatus Woesearchaeota archaeon]|nr:hypothetical protein [Candidatus Woesearchaeota archaeon]